MLEERIIYFVSSLCILSDTVILFSLPHSNLATERR